MWNWCLKEVLVGCGLALLVMGGVWQDRRQAAPAATSVDLTMIPRTLGDWTSTDFELPEQDAAAAGIDRYLGRNYVHAETANGMTVLIASGPGGPISVHPPEVCFVGQGYLKDSAIGTVKAPALSSDQEHQFSTAVFRGPASSGGTRVQLFWAWSDSGIWQTPANPRLVFARLPRLYKIYVYRTLDPKQGSEDVKEGLEFMKLLLPEFEKLMSPSSENPSTPADTPPADGVAETATAEPLLPEFVPSRHARRNVLQIARPMSAQFPAKDGDFRL